MAEPDERSAPEERSDEGATREPGEPGEPGEPASPDLLSIGLVVFFVALILVVAGLLVLPALT